MQVKTIYLAPTGLLHRLSFSALQHQNGKRLLDRYKLNQVFSTRSVVKEEPERQQPVSMSLWGDIAYQSPSRNQLRSIKEAKGRSGFPGNWPPLPGTKREIKGIEKLCRTAGVRSEIVSGAVATEEKFKAYDGKSPDVLHVATHGYFSPEMFQSHTHPKVTTIEAPENGRKAMLGSYLVLAGCGQSKERTGQMVAREDGILTAYEIAQMDLGGTKLAVLSACNTAIGELRGNEGVIGLQRAFKLAGVRQMIVSLWKVPDKETTEIMRLFYRYWLSGKDSREALHAAQLNMKKKYPNPFFWAAFILAE